MTRYGSSFAVGFVIGVLALFALGILTGRDIRYMGEARGVSPGQQTLPNTEADEEFAIDEANAAELRVEGQSAGLTALVQGVTLDAAGWAVVHEIEGGHILNALGAARLDAGAFENVSIELLRGTEPGREYAVVLYTDDGDKAFELRGDLPMIDSEGNPIMQTFRTFGGAAN